MTCSLETIALYAGLALVRPGDVIDIPRWRYEQASAIEISQAKGCMRRKGVRYRIVAR